MDESDYSPKVAHDARMTTAELLHEVRLRLREGTLVLPEDPTERNKALQMAILRIMGERYHAKMPAA